MEKLLLQTVKRKQEILLSSSEQLREHNQDMNEHEQNEDNNGESDSEGT